MKIKTKTVKINTYSIEDMTAAEAAAVAFLLGRAEKGLSTATYEIYCALINELDKNADRV
jgi:hypothetical protein